MEKEEAKNGSVLNLRDINKSISKLKAEYGIKMRKNRDTETMTSRFMEALNTQRLRFKRKTKAEKTARIVARKARRDAKRGKKTGAKFEASYDG
jgi:transcription initiation factor IIE alpha subunit